MYVLCECRFSKHKITIAVRSIYSFCICKKLFNGNVCIALLVGTKHKHRSTRTREKKKGRTRAGASFGEQESERPTERTSERVSHESEKDHFAILKFLLQDQMLSAFTAPLFSLPARFCSVLFAYYLPFTVSSNSLLQFSYISSIRFSNDVICDVYGMSSIWLCVCVSARISSAHYSVL